MADEPVHLEPAGAAWAQRYRDWSVRIHDALVDAFDGGVLLDLEHVGSTAVPGLRAKPTLDVMARVHPWPLPPERASALAALGFVDHGEHGLAGRRYVAHRDHAVHLHVVGPESDHWTRQLALRDLLRAEAGARERYERSVPVVALEREALAWSVRHRGFEPLAQVRAWLEGAPPSWAFAGGWALDARAGAPARAHDDVDVAVDRRATAAVLDRLQGAGVEVAWVIAGTGGVAGYRRRPLGETPPEGVHQAHARCDGSWVDVVLEPWTDVVWRYRRAPAIELPLDRAIERVVAAGVEVPVLAPAAVLLFKATTGGRPGPRPKDDADLRRVRGLLTSDDVAWLRAALGATAPGHPWCAPGGALA